VINAVITIQTAYRKYLHDKITKLIDNMTNIQSAIRGKLLRHRVEKRRAVVVVVQRRWRDIREDKFQRRIGIAREAMVGFQAVARGLLVRERLEHLRSAVHLVEEHRVVHLKGRAARARYLLLRKATVMIQTWWRDRMAVRTPRKRFILAIQGTVKLQALVRGALARHRHAEYLSASVSIQLRYKAYRAAKRARMDFLAIRLAALNMQRQLRSSLLARKERHRYIALRTRAIQLQRHWTKKIRRRNSAVLIQRAWRKFAWLVRLRKMLGEVIIVQSLWRGHRVRQGSNSRVRIARKRVGKAMSTPVSEGDTLAGRLNKGLELIKTSAGYGRGIMQLGICAFSYFT
jgi:abnormal spindle-like microcephaly-associated protein